MLFAVPPVPKPFRVILRSLTIRPIHSMTSRLLQLERGRDRERQAFDTIQHQRDARKAINQEMRERVAENQDRENGRDDRRLEALRSRRQQREVLLANQKEELEITFANRRVSVYVYLKSLKGMYNAFNFFKLNDCFLGHCIFYLLKFFVTSNLL